MSRSGGWNAEPGDCPSPGVSRRTPCVIRNRDSDGGCPIGRCELPESPSLLRAEEAAIFQVNTRAAGGNDSEKSPSKAICCSGSSGARRRSMRPSAMRHCVGSIGRPLISFRASSAGGCERLRRVVKRRARAGTCAASATVAAAASMRSRIVCERMAGSESSSQSIVSRRDNILLHASPVMLG